MCEWILPNWYMDLGMGRRYSSFSKSWGQIIRHAAKSGPRPCPTFSKPNSIEDSGRPHSTTILQTIVIFLWVCCTDSCSEVPHSHMSFLYTVVCLFCGACNANICHFYSWKRRFQNVLESSKRKFLCTCIYVKDYHIFQCIDFIQQEALPVRQI